MKLSIIALVQKSLPCPLLGTKQFANITHLRIASTVELRLSELIKTRGGSDKLIVRIIEQHAIHMKLDHITHIVAHC